MSATGQLIAALVAGGMDAAEAAGLVARAAVEMTGVVNARSTGAIRQQRFRDREKKRNEALRSVTTVTQGSEGERNETSPNVTVKYEPKSSLSVTNSNEASRSNAAANSPLTYLLPIQETGLSEKQESKKERYLKKRNGPLPENWKVPARAIELAAALGLEIEPIEGRFRDYLASSGKLYADYDAGFCNFVRNTPNFNGSNRGNGTGNHRTDLGPGRATTREAQLVAAVGRGAAGRLADRVSAGPHGPSSDDAGSAALFDSVGGSKNAH